MDVGSQLLVFEPDGLTFPEWFFDAKHGTGCQNMLLTFLAGHRFLEASLSIKTSFFEELLHENHLFGLFFLCKIFCLKGGWWKRFFLCKRCAVERVLCVNACLFRRRLAV